MNSSEVKFGMGVPTVKLDLDVHTPYLLMRVANKISSISERKYREHASHYGLNLRDFRALGIIAIRAPISPADIAEATGMDRATITRAVRVLVNEGLVYEIKNESDLRGKFVVATAKGAKVCDHIFPLMSDVRALVEQAFSKEDHTQFVRLLQLLHEYIRALD